MRVRSPLHVFKSNRGVALLVTLFSVVFMTFLAYEFGYTTSVELRVGQGQLDRLKATYLAKSGIRISLLRIHIFKKATSLNLPGVQPGMLDIIWQFPFAWPPQAPDEASNFDKDEIKKIAKESYFEGSFATRIEGEGGKIDINDLGTPVLAQSVRAQLSQLIANRLAGDDTWARDNRSLNVDEIVNNIADWVSPGNTSATGGDKSGKYGDTDPRYSPPMRSMKTLDELHMVKGVSDEIYKVIAPRITVYGIKGVNVNTASKEVIKSLDRTLTDEAVSAIMERRNDPTKGGPFGSVSDFTNFISTFINVQNFNKDQEGRQVVPLTTDPEMNFRITSVGNYKRATREIVAIVYDFDKVKGRTIDALKASDPKNSQTGGTAQKPPPAQPSASPTPAAAPAPAVAPRIVYWHES